MDLITVAESLDLPREHLHFKGKPIRFDGALKGRIAEKHYVGFAAQTTNDWLEAENFAAANLQLVAGKYWFGEFLKLRKIEATVWICATGKIPTPVVRDELFAKAAALGVSIHVDHPMASS